MLAKADDYSLTSIFVSYLDLKTLKCAIIVKLRYISAHMGVPSAETTENSNFWLHLPMCLHPGDQSYILMNLTMFKKIFGKDDISLEGQSIQLLESGMILKSYYQGNT